MLRFRPDLNRVETYTPGKPIDEVARELGIDDIVKLASNENPEPPLPSVVAVITDAAAEAHRYPDSSCYRLSRALADFHGLTPDYFWLGAGSSELLGCIALSMGGSGTSAVFATPSFAMYPIGTAVAGAEAIRVPLDANARHDLKALGNAIRQDTTVIYVCNPNNPTGTHVGSAAIESFVESTPSDRLIVLDEAYAEYATAPDYASGMSLVDRHPNVVVLRTFSKAYGLAGLRVGYAVGQPATLAMLRKPQRPFSVIQMGQNAAAASLTHTDELERRVKVNAAQRDELESALSARNLAYVPSQTNFVLFNPADAAAVAARLLELGVIVRLLGSSIRVSVGTARENDRFIAALDEVLER